jgi:hypothetical protein
MRAKIFTIGLGIAALCALIGWRVLTWPYAPQNGSPSEIYVRLLQNFQTYTVDVKVKGKDSPHQIFGKDEGQLSDEALDIVSSIVKGRFENIRYSRYGSPYSYEKNPLNVSITFFLNRSLKDPLWFDVRASVRRSSFFSYYMHGKETGRVLGSDDDEAREYMLPGAYATIMPSPYPFPDGIKNESELKSAFEFYAAEITQRMAPNYEDAVNAEENLLKRVHLK